MRHLIRVPCGLTLLIAAVVSLPAELEAAEPAIQEQAEDASPDWNVLPPEAGNNQLLRNVLLRMAGKQFDQRRRELAEALTSPEALQKYHERKRDAYLELLGSLPERTPLRPRVTGKIECKGYHIEKILFETMPKHRATALLYVPDGKGPFPGVLFVCGHSTNGKAAEGYQLVPALMARYGLMVLAVDPIGQGERFQQFQMRGGTTTHTLYDVGARLVGRSVAFYEAWDNVRAVDYLLTRSEIDSSKPIGLTGTSGGGTQTTFLMALDERIGPASPSCYIMTRERKFVEPGLSDGCQHLPDEGLRGIEHADYAIMRLPRPTQVLAAEKDFFDIKATRIAGDEITRAYKTAGQPDRFELFVSDTPHGFTAPHRVAATRWMCRWLLEQTDALSDADDLQVFPDEQLNVTRSGQVGRDIEDEVNVGELNLRRARELQSQRDAFWRDHTSEQAVDRIRKLLRIRDPLPKAETRRVAESEHAGCRVQKLILQHTDDVPLPALLITPLKATNGELPATLIVDSLGKSASTERAFGLAQSGRIVLTVDLRGYGETRDIGSRSKYFNHEQYTGYLAMHIGRPLMGQRVEDVLAAVDTLASAADVDSQDVELLGIRAAGPVALHAAVLDARITSVRTEESIQSWIDDVVARPLERDLMGYVVPDALSRYDLPDLVELFNKR